MPIQCILKMDEVAKIHIDCPPVNALDSTQMASSLSTIINDLSEDKSVNVIVDNRMAGKGFCGGADKSETMKIIAI